MTILVIDNYDSFTWNVVQQIYQAAPVSPEITVIRNDEWSIEDVVSLHPKCVIISPGPGGPEASNLSLEVLKTAPDRFPILGICLGHQALARAFGGEIVRGAHPTHGKASPVFHDGKGIFRSIASPMQAGRYHSLVVERKSLPKVLRVTAELEDGTIMALEHEDLPLYGVQFHPESFLTESGEMILKNFFQSARYD